MSYLYVTSSVIECTRYGLYYNHSKIKIINGGLEGLELVSAGSDMEL